MVATEVASKKQGDRGTGLRVLTGQGAAVDTTTSAGRLAFGTFAAIAEFERELIVSAPGPAWPRFGRAAGVAAGPTR